MFPKSSPKELEQEIETLQRNYDQIKKNIGKFVLIQGDSVVSYSKSYSEAVAAGYKRFGLENFLVRPVRSQETPVRAMRCGVIKTDGKLRITRPKPR